VSDTPTVEDAVQQVIASTTTERETAIALHDIVREGVKFGFNKYFDAAEPDEVLACGVGHCNPKSRLLAALFRAAGLESYQHFVVIPKEILKGALPASRYWMIPPELSHSYVEVQVEGTWVAIDSHSVDTALLRAAQARLAEEGRALGYGVRVDSTNVWDGEHDAFSQFDPGLMVEDHGRIEDLEAYFGSEQYRHQVLGLRFNTLFRLRGDAGVAAINAHIDGVRGQGTGSGQERALPPLRAGRGKGSIA
jgi:hypothetical protein